MGSFSGIDNQALLDFINHDLLLNRMMDAPVLLETDLIDTGVIDSLSLIQLVTYIEKQAGIEVNDWDVIPENFQTVQKILDYLEKRSRE